MEPRSSWLFPLMVVAAGSVTAFGCIGIAAITGHLPAARPGGERQITEVKLASESAQPALSPAPPADGTTKAMDGAAKSPARKKPIDRTVN